MTNPENDGAGDHDQSKLDAELTSKTTTVDLENGDDSKAQLINANGGAGTDVRYEGTAASSDGEVSFNGLGKEEVMRYADEPFWKRLRVILLVMFWLGWLAMLVTAVIIIAVAPRCPPRPDHKWYQKETVYQVLPESFYDGNDDGIGDFDGLNMKMDYIDSLGIKAVWLNKIFKTSDDYSELGIMDHMELNDKFGTTSASFQAWIKNLQKDGKKVIVDLIINQVSKEHEWFKKSAKKDGSKYEDYFIWKKSSGVPNNWKTQDGNVGWTEDPVRGEWYYHAFGADYPDLNLNNTDVVDEIKEIMNFWFSAGVSGFHIKDVEYLVERPDLADDGNKHNKETLYLLEELRAVSDSFSMKPGRERFLFGTTYSANVNQTADLWSGDNKRRLHMVLPVMSFFDKDTDANKIVMEVEKNLYDTDHQWLGLALGNQYVSRVASRVEDSTHKMIPAFALEMLLPGTPFNYYGDEFGQLNGVLGSNKAVPTSPMQWNNQDNAGFCAKGVGYEDKDGNVKDWMDVIGKPASTFTTNNLKSSQTHFSSVMTPYQAFGRLQILRAEESFQWGKTKVCAINKDLFTIKREAFRFPPFVVMMNLGKSEMNFDLSQRLDCVGSKPMATVRFHSSMSDQVGETLDFHMRPVVLKSGDVVVLEYEAEEP